MHGSDGSDGHPLEDGEILDTRAVVEVEVVQMGTNLGRGGGWEVWGWRGCGFS